MCRVIRRRPVKPTSLYGNTTTGCTAHARMSTHTQQDVCCLMGDPVAENPTHYMLEKAFAVADLDWRFLTFEVSADDFEAALAGAGSSIFAASCLRRRTAAA